MLNEGRLRKYLWRGVTGKVPGMGLRTVLGVVLLLAALACGNDITIPALPEVGSSRRSYIHAGTCPGAHLGNRPGNCTYTRSSLEFNPDFNFCVNPGRLHQTRPFLRMPSAFPG